MIGFGGVAEVLFANLRDLIVAKVVQRTFGAIKGSDGREGM